MHLSGEARHLSGQPALALRWDMRPVLCQQLLDALPDALVPMLRPFKLSGEFKSLGANLVIAPRENGETFSAELLARLAEKEPQVASVPWLYAVGKTGYGNVVMAGTEFARLAAVSPISIGVSGVSPIRATSA
jgi:hypothetical protein